MPFYKPAPLLAFDSESAEFVRGFEAGRLLTLVRARPSETVEDYAHVENAEMMMRIAEATRREVRGQEIGEGWMLIRFGPAEPDTRAAKARSY